MNDIKIFLIGMMGAGKTSVGLTLSRVLGFPFFDTDELIGVDSYFNNHTIDEFRLEEIKQINKISNQHDRAVISIGGGAILSAENREIISFKQFPEYVDCDYLIIFNKSTVRKLRILTEKNTV